MTIIIHLVMVIAKYCDHKYAFSHCHLLGHDHKYTFSHSHLHDRDHKYTFSHGHLLDRDHKSIFSHSRLHDRDQISWKTLEVFLTFCHSFFGAHHKKWNHMSRPLRKL